tara:strand:- start:7434 stop:8066 length:633 start_codon:yes stop_codon:yes gene_type:complete
LDKQLLKRRIANYVPNFLIEIYKTLKIINWYSRRNCSMPAPYFIKQSILIKNSVSSAVWIETGTLYGDTTRFLSENFVEVHTIEPSNYYYEKSKSLLKNSKNIVFHKGSSSECLSSICKNLQCDISFWLDGHYSGGKTYSDVLETPIIQELEIIDSYIHNFKKISIFIDDVRECFNKAKDYPSLDNYVNWAKKNNFKWTIDQDIFIMKNF